MDYFTSLSLFAGIVYVFYHESQKLEKVKQKNKFLCIKVEGLENRVTELEGATGAVQKRVVQQKGFEGIIFPVPEPVATPAPVQQNSTPEPANILGSPLEARQVDPIPPKVVVPKVFNPVVEDEQSFSEESSDSDSSSDESESVHRELSEEIDILNGLKKYEGGDFKDFAFAVDARKLKYRILRVNGDLAYSNSENLKYDKNVVGVFIKTVEGRKVIEKICDVGGVKI